MGLSKEVKRYDPSEVLTDRWEMGSMDESDNGDYVRWEDYTTLKEALEFACKSLTKITSADGSGHADIALSVLRVAGVGSDEREALVEGWKASAQWRLDKKENS